MVQCVAFAIGLTPARPKAGVKVGFIVFLIAPLFCIQENLTGAKLFKPSMIIYNSGLIVTAIMFFVRGISQALTAITPPLPDAAIPGTADLGHICIGVRLVLLILVLKKMVAKKHLTRAGAHRYRRGTRITAPRYNNPQGHYCS